jgi:hypothetical protein
MGHCGFIFFFLNQNACKWKFGEPASWQILRSVGRAWLLRKKPTQAGRMATARALGSERRMAETSNSIRQ